MTKSLGSFALSLVGLAVTVYVVKKVWTSTH